VFVRTSVTAPHSLKRFIGQFFLAVVVSFAYVCLLTGCNDASTVSTSPVSTPPSSGGLIITTTSLQSATVGQPYNFTVAGSGGAPPYTWLVTPALPSALQLNTASGVISGTPGANTIGTTSHTFVLQDSASNSDTLLLTLTVNPATLAINPITLPPGVINQPYSQTTLTATGGVPPYTWSVSPSLPNGLQFNVAGPGTISGTPLNGTVGMTDHTFTVTDNSAPTRRTASTDPPLRLTITSLFITTNSPLPNARVGRSYNTTLQRSGGTAPFTWSVSAPLPSGLQLNSTTGVIFGTPAQGTLGVHTRTYTVQDSSNPRQSFSKPLTLNITN